MQPLGYVGEQVDIEQWARFVALEHDPYMIGSIIMWL